LVIWGRTVLVSVGENKRRYPNPELSGYQLAIPYSPDATRKTGTATIANPQIPTATKRLRKAKNLPFTEQPLFINNNYEMTATGAPIISATQAYLKQPDWNKYSDGKLYFSKEFGKGRYIEFYILHQQAHQPQYILDSAEHQILEKYGVMAARLHAVFATYAAQQQEPWKEPFILRGSELIKTLQIYKSKKLSKSQKLKAIADLAMVVGTLGAVIQWYEGDLNLCIKERCLLWMVSVQEYSQPNLFQEPEDLLEVIIRVQPGLWTYNFLNAEGEKAKTALYQCGFIPKEVFDLDTHQHKLAFNLALYIIQNNGTCKNGIYTVRNLLANILPANQIEKLVNDYRYGWRLKEDLEEALLLLKDKVNMTIEFDDETYPLWLRPVWAIPEELAHLSPQERNQKLLGKKKLPDNYIQNILLPAKLSFKLPSSQINNNKSVKNQKNTKFHTKSNKAGVKTQSQVDVVINNSTVAETLGVNNGKVTVKNIPVIKEITGSLVKQMRTAKKMSQRDFAHAVGMSQSWVRDIETKGKDAPIPEKYTAIIKEVLNFR
jgi:DNA-binding transcriptional regulator YiaG